MHERIRDAGLGAWGRWVTTHPRATLLVCLLLAVVAVVLTLRHLEFRADRSALVDPDLSWNRRYERYRERFDRWDDVVVVLDGPAHDPRVDDLARTIAASIVTSERVAAADAGFDARDTGPRFYLTAPGPLFDEALAALGAARALLAAENANAALATAVARLSAAGDASGSLEHLEDFLEPYLVTLEGGTPPVFDVLRTDRSRWQAFASGGSGRLRIVQVQLAETTGRVDDVSANLSWLREHVSGLVRESGVAGLEWGVTGIPAIEADETKQSIHDSTVASIVAFVLITALMLAVFRGVVVPLLAAGALLLGMTWSFGWLVLAVGHLQLLSVVFTVILLGLGIDFALHLVARLELVCDEHDDLPSAMARVFRGVGPGMLTGAVTTAAAFGATALTEFRGMAEMGVIAGGGIMLCLIAMLSGFPAGLAATGRWKSVIRHRRGGETAHFAHGAFDTIDFHPAASLTAAVIAIAALVVPALHVQYDPNVLNLHPPGIESVAWERRLVEDDAGTVWYAIVETDADAAPALVEALRARPEIGDVGAMGLLLPADLDDRMARIDAARTAPVTARTAGLDLLTLRTSLAGVRLGLLRRVPAAPPDVAPRLRALADRLQRALAGAARLDGAEGERRLAALDDAFLDARRTLAAFVDRALAPVPPGPVDLPETLRARWSDDETWLLQVYPAPDAGGRSILHPDRLAAFVEAVRDVAPTVLGPPVQIYESSVLIQREYTKAAIYAIVAILVLLLLDFRSLADALCAITPVTVGFVGAFGMMGMFEIPLNFANIIVMPLIFGIGVDAGVHVVHRWRAEPYGRPAGLSGGTGRGITLTMASTMIGFGCMVLAEHRGIRSLGFVMVAGLGVTLLACCAVLPAILRLRTPPWTRGR